MAKKTFKIELSIEKISNYIYALDGAITDTNAYNSPMQFELLNELKDKLSKLYTQKNN